jgi:hypothetical protein
MGIVIHWVTAGPQPRRELRMTLSRTGPLASKTRGAMVPWSPFSKEPVRKACLGGGLALATLFAPASARAQPVFHVEPIRPPSAPSVEDPTGGAYTTPTLLFIPAAAVPSWTGSVIASLDVQGPAAPDRLALENGSVGFAPGIGGEVGLPYGFTLGAGTNWVGGDVSPTPISGGLSPYVQARYAIVGGRSGRGFLLGTSLTYKFVGFHGDPGEMEWAVSAQYRRERYEAGVQAVLGKDFATTDADAELHAYALYRLVPVLGVGAAGQARFGLVSQPGDSTYDVVAGPIASLTISRWQVAALSGVTTLGLNQGLVGALAQVFGTVHF